MVYNIIGSFFIMVFGVVVINVGIWISRKLNNLEYDKDMRKGVLLTTCIIGVIYYIINIVNFFHK